MRALLGFACVAAALPLAAQLRITEICPRPGVLDPNGRESGWIELTNTSETEPVSLAEYSLVRWNRGKKDKEGSRKPLPQGTLAPGARLLVYTSEAYDNAKDLGGQEDIRAYPVGNGGEIIVFPFKLNPKKWPNLRLYKGSAVVDTFAVPVDIADGMSFAPGQDTVVSALVDSATAYDYRADGAEWVGGGHGRLAGVAAEEPKDAPGRLEATPQVDAEAFAPGSVTDANGLTRTDAHNLSGNTGKNTGLTLPAEVAAQLTDRYTVALWFRAEAGTAGSRPLFDSRPSASGNASGIIVFLTEEGQISVQPRSATKGNQTLSSDTEEDYADGAWHHLTLVAGQRIGEPVALWVDGRQVISATLTVEAALHANLPLCFGRAYDSTYWAAFDGALADIRVWPRALAEAEAAAVMDEGPAARDVTGALTATGDTLSQTEGAYVFAGASQSTEAYVEASIPAAQVAAGETVDFWVRPAAFPASGSHSAALIDARAASAAGYMLIVNGSGALTLQRGVGSTTSFEETPLEASLTLDTWTHITLTLDKARQEVALFLNGQETSRITLSKPYSAATASHRFGGTRDSWWTAYVGRLAAPKVYSGVLSATEIAKLHNASPLASSKVLVSGTVADAQTVVAMPETLVALEARTVVTFPAPAEGDQACVEAEAVGALTLTLDGAPLTPGVSFPAPAAGEHTLAWRVEPGAEGVAAEVALTYLRAVRGTTRVILPHPTPGAENTLAEAIPYGPNIGPEIDSGAGGNGVTAASPAPAGADYDVTYEIHPLSAGEETAIVGVTLLYRVDFKETKRLPMVALPGENKWKATIPAADLPAPGHLLRYAAQIVDGAGNTWRSPSFRNPDDGYEWYGTIVEPEAGQADTNLQTFHLFADATALSLMDRQYDAVAGTHPYGARVGIFESQKNVYYDNVRIDLRGNTSAGFRKKSHGLRFNKCQPLICANPFDGETIETRKTSFIAEYCDPTYIRQALSFWMWRQAGNLVPFDYPVRLRLNGEFYQLAFHSNRFTDELIEDYYKLDPLGYGYKNVGTFAPKGMTTAGGIEKKTPDDDNEHDLSVLLAFCEGLAPASAGAATENATLTQKVVREFDLPAWLNYLAAARITQEADDVWANICAYGDLNNTGTWRPLPYDHNLSFGQWYYNDNPIGKIGLRPIDDGYKSHPFYGGFHVKASGFKGNYAIEAVLQSPKFRRLYLRRLRTLMDTLLKAPGTPKEETPFWQKALAFRAAFEAEAALDRAKWEYNTYATKTQIWVWDHALSLEEGFTDLWDNYIVPRRNHLFVTHAATNTAREVGYGTNYNAGIPEAQAPTAELAAAITFANATDTDGSVPGFTATDALVIRNANPVAVDMSGWKLTGAVAWTLPAGTVVDAEGDLYVAFDRKAYVAAQTLTDQVIVGNATRATATFLKLTDAEGVPVRAVSWAEPTAERKYLRVAEVLANTADNGGDGAEYVCLVNRSDADTLTLGGIRLRAKKSGDEPWKVNITLPEGLTLAPGATLRLEKAAFAGAGWDKLTNNKVDMELCEADGTLIQSLHFESSWWPATDGGGAALVALAFGDSVTAKEDWRPSFDLPGDATAAAAVTQAIAARPALTQWLSAPTNKDALAAFTGDAQALDLCWLVDVPPQAAPDVKLALTSLTLDASGNPTLTIGLSVNGVAKEGAINGSLILRGAATLAGPFEEMPLPDKTFPARCSHASEPTRFFQVILR